MKVGRLNRRTNLPPKGDMVGDISKILQTYLQSRDAGFWPFAWILGGCLCRGRVRFEGLEKSCYCQVKNIPAIPVALLLQPRKSLQKVLLLRRLSCVDFLLQPIASKSLQKSY